MLWTIAIILLILWLLGMVSFHALGAYVHILLVLAIIAVLIRIVQGRNPSSPVAFPSIAGSAVRRIT